LFFFGNWHAAAAEGVSMRARPVIEGRTYMFTRRCSERRFFLRPDSTTNNAFWYCLGWAAQTHGILLHAAVAMSNHVHVVATDPRGVYPNFLRDFHGLLARVVNAARGHWEHFWDANQASAVLLADEAAQVDKLAYVLANPVGLVKLAADWPGATALHAVLTAAPVVATRPDHFFREEKNGGAMPASVTLTFEPPPTLATSSRKDYVALIRTAVAKIEREADERRRASNTAVLGPRRVETQSWAERPGDPEPRRQVNPHVACRDKWLRIERLDANRTFQEFYRAAFDDFRRGVATIFPFGTWLMRFRAVIQVNTA
jgi:putative transposase